MHRVKDLGFLIGVHTNGFYPETLKRASDFIDWIGLDYKATRIKYPELVGQNIAHDNMIKSLSVWLDTGKDFEIRITCDPRHITKLDLLEIIQDLHSRGVKKIAIQKYIPHFEDNEHGTTPEQRAQYFNDEKLREDINSKFESVIWRE